VGHPHNPPYTGHTHTHKLRHISHTLTLPELHEKWEDKEFVVEFDFLGKDSIRYQNWVAVNKRVFKNLKIFTKDKEGSDDLVSLIKYLHISYISPSAKLLLFNFNLHF